MNPRHAREFQKALGNHQYEVSPAGILFPEAKVYVKGLYSFRTNDGPWEDQENLIPTEGLNAMLNNYNAATGVAGYVSLYAGAISPTSAWTAASYPATANEITSGSEGYTESTRVLWNAATASAASKDNYASVAVFTIITATTLTVNGIGLHTVSTKGGTTGVLMSATRFNAPKTFSNTDEFDVKYRLSLTSS
jgi:hypothetical protein